MMAVLVLSDLVDVVARLIVEAKDYGLAVWSGSRNIGVSSSPLPSCSSQAWFLDSKSFEHRNYYERQARLRRGCGVAALRCGGAATVCRAASQHKDWQHCHCSSAACARYCHNGAHIWRKVKASALLQQYYVMMVVRTRNTTFLLAFSRNSCTCNPRWMM